MEDDNCVSCNYSLVSQQCELSNGTKALFPDEFVNKNYQRCFDRPLLDLCLSMLKDYYTNYTLRNRLKQTFNLEDTLLEIMVRYLTTVLLSSDRTAKVLW